MSYKYNDHFVHWGKKCSDAYKYVMIYIAIITSILRIKKLIPISGRICQAKANCNMYIVACWSYTMLFFIIKIWGIQMHPMAHIYTSRSYQLTKQSKNWYGREHWTNMLVFHINDIMCSSVNDNLHCIIIESWISFQDKGHNDPLTCYR